MSKYFLFLFLFSCQSNIVVDNKSSEISSPVTTEISPESFSPPSDSSRTAYLIIDDSSFYSEKFLKELNAAKSQPPIRLKDDYMILAPKDTVYFPVFPVMNRKTMLTGRKGNLAVALMVERTNYTSIQYQIEMVEFGKFSKTEKGTAELETYFYFSSESDTDDLTGTSYFSTSYTTQEEDCHLVIRIGNPEDTPNKPLLAKIIKNCNGEIRDIGLDNFPVLHEK